MAEIVISCANDPDFAMALHSHLLLYLHPINKSSIVLESDEIYIQNDEDDFVARRKKIIEAVTSFTKAKKDYENHQITEFGDIITVAIPATPEQLLENILTCEMCNYMSPYEEQLRLHRMTHGNVMIGS